MAFDAATEWEVRTTGSDNNGGGFKIGAAGTDFSQQDAAQHAYTDLVIDGTTNTKITSAIRPFSSVDVGNVINITSGTGFTVQRVQIVSVDGSAIATCDKAVGTLGSTAGAGNLGGGLLTPAAAFALIVAGNTIWLKAGTYTITAALISSAANFRVQGYQTLHGDRTGTRPLITMVTDSTNILIRNSASTTFIILDNLSLSNTAASRGSCFYNLSSGLPTIYINFCKFDGFSSGFSGSQLYNLVIINSEITNSTSSAITNAPGSIIAIDCNIHDSTNAAISISSGNAILCRTLITANAAGGISITNIAANVKVIGCTIANNGNNGISFNSASAGLKIIVESCIIYGNTGYGISFASGTYNLSDPSFIKNNAFGANTSGNHQNYTTGDGSVSLTEDPFTNSAAGDYSLNDAVGGGALCKQAGYSVADIL